MFKISLLVAVSAVLLGYLFYSRYELPSENTIPEHEPEHERQLPQNLVSVGRMNIDLNSREFFLVRYIDDEVVLRGSLGRHFGSATGQECEHTLVSGFGHCTEFPQQARLHVMRRASSTTDCYDIIWEPLGDGDLEDCFNLAESHWYGGAELLHQYWPIEKSSVPMQPYQTSDAGFIRDETSYGGFIERLWLNSKGVGIFVDSSVHLHASINANNDEKLCLKSKLYDIGKYSSTNTDLRHTICVGADVKDVYTHLSAKYINKPDGIPDEKMFRSPVWSTWARYKMAVNQTKVLDFAHEIVSRGFPNSQLEIDDMWSPAYGDFEFARDKFPDAKAMISSLHSMGFRVTAWVIPFVKLDSQAYREGAATKYLVLDATTDKPLLTRWWQGDGALVDFTNPGACQWFIGRLEILRKSVGLNSYKIDAGETNFLPTSTKTHAPLTEPGDYTKFYVDCVARLGRQIEVRVGHHTQKYAVHQRMFDKDSTWGYDNGLKTMIPTALVMGIIGYPFNLPDMIGGNAYDPVDISKTVFPERELFIRWMQLTAYLPSMQFSLSPWQYDDEVVEIALKMVQVHEDIVTPIVLKAAREATVSGTPIIRPLWWTSPKDEVALTTDSEYLVGDDLLVAPILEGASRSRDIYLPKGRWIDDLRGGEHKGAVWLKNYRVDLSEIATFTRVKN
ncbi:myogenesis-regulating glycosidase-like [Ptychodera flava]|uniref:myogenesis-regulating glycosidase-like n=1 Tax=Ptychodera flava TaxID=63121 RepID=UPI00396A724D